MQDMGIVHGCAEQAQPLIVGTDTVYLHSQISEYTDENGALMYQYNEIQYTKDEYIELISKKNAELEENVTTLESAVLELADLIGGAE